MQTQTRDHVSSSFKKFQNVLKCLAFFSCLFLPLLNCLTELPLGSCPECPHSCRLSTDLFREAASCHVGDWGIFFYFFIFCTAEQTQRACRPVLPMGPMLLTFEPFRVQLHSPASLTSVEKNDRKESMPVPGGVAKKSNPGGAAKLSVWEPWKRRTESRLAARETTNTVHPWAKMKDRCHFHLCLSHRLLIAWLLPSIQRWVRCLTGV